MPRVGEINQISGLQEYRQNIRVKGLLAEIVAAQNVRLGLGGGAETVFAHQTEPFGGLGPLLCGKAVQLEAPEGPAVVGQQPDGLEIPGNKLLRRVTSDGIDGEDGPGAGGRVPVVAGDEAAFSQAQALGQLCAAVLHPKIPQNPLGLRRGQFPRQLGLDAGADRVFLVVEHEDPPVGTDRQGALIRLGAERLDPGDAFDFLRPAAHLVRECDADPGRRPVQPVPELVCLVEMVRVLQRPALPLVDGQEQTVGVVLRHQGPGHGALQIVIDGPAPAGPAVSHGEPVRHRAGRRRLDGGGGDSARAAGGGGGGGSLPAPQITQEEKAPRAQGDQQDRRGSGSGPGPALPGQDRLLGSRQQVLAHVVQTVHQFFRFHSKPSFCR